MKNFPNRLCVLHIHIRFQRKLTGASSDRSRKPVLFIVKCQHLYSIRRESTHNIMFVTFEYAWTWWLSEASHRALLIDFKISPLTQLFACLLTRNMYLRGMTFSIEFICISKYFIHFIFLFWLNIVHSQILSLRYGEAHTHTHTHFALMSKEGTLKTENDLKHFLLLLFICVCVCDRIKQMSQF